MFTDKHVAKCEDGRNIRKDSSSHSGDEAKTFEIWPSFINQKICTILLFQKEFPPQNKI
jgi:hypothetical protein